LAADETPVPEAPLTWSLPDTAVAAFDAASRSLTGKSLGETELKVRAPGEGLEATWQITVIEGGLALDSEELTLTRGEERPIIASFTDQSGAPVSEASGVTWTSSDPGVLEIDDEGLLSATGFGTARVLVSTPWGSFDSATVYVQGEVLITYASGGSADLYSFDRGEPGQLHQITNEPGSEVDGQFSPDGTRLVYVTDQGGNRDIVAANADGSSPTRLTSTVYEEHSPSWTPDGTSIVYESDFGGTPQIWIMNADGSDQRQLTQDEWWSGHPVVSPNGSTIAYVVARDDETDIYLMNLDGTNQRNFTASEINEALPAWVGDSALAYLTEERRNRVMTRTVTRMNFMREVTNLSPEGLPVTDFAISRDGETLGVIVSAQGPQGQESRLYFIPLVGDATPGEVPRASQGDQMLSPSFRR
jgi:dipeptidyl aminopeptidase/acylaminoacyl peptidase